MELNSENVTPAATDAITDRYEVETNIAVEPVKEVETPKSDSQPEPSEEPQESKTINPRTQARKAEKERLIRENAAMAERLKQFETKAEPAKPEAKKPKDLSKEPNILDYGDDVLEYTRDISRYEALQAFKQETSKMTQQKQIEAYSQRADILRAEKPDFDEKVNSLIESGLLTEDIESSILASDMSEKLSYHLAEFGGDLVALRGLPKELLPKAIKEIESFIKKGGEQPQEKPRVTQAAPPITPPGNSAKTDRSISSFSQEEIENMPIAEFNRLAKHK